MSQYIDNAILKCYTNNYDEFDKSSIENIVNIVNTSLKNDDIIIENTFINQRISKIKDYRSVLAKLKKLPLIKQRTTEWFEMRKNRLTASDLYDAISKGSGNNLAIKKAHIFTDNTNYNKIPSLKWGTMFENMASRCYSQSNFNINIEEFGLICDKYNEHFGASPDGINELGIMIEIKCPYSRKIIENFIPQKYQIQIQGQLAVCELEECDYIECDFEIFNTIEEYEINIPISDKENHGVIVEYKTNNKDFYYIYSDAYLSPNDAVKNAQDQVAKFDNPLKYTFNKFIPWKLKEMKIQRVKFNKEEWYNIDKKIHQFWETVEKIKINPPVQKAKKKIHFIDDD